MTYYVISTTYIGPNQHTTNDSDNILDGDYYDICTKPGMTNQSREERIEGWLGSTNDWSLTAHGAFETIEAAREKIASEIGRPLADCRTRPEGYYTYGPPADEVERYYVSPYTDVWNAGDYAGTEGIEATTSDEEIAKIAEEIGELAEKGKILLIGDVKEWLTEVRDGLKAEVDDEAA